MLFIYGTLGQQHSLGASLSYVETRQVSNDYTIQVDRQTWQIARAGIRAGLRGADVRIEVRLDGSLAAHFRKSYLAVSPCQPRPQVANPKVAVRRARKPAAPRAKSREYLVQTAVAGWFSVSAVWRAEDLASTWGSAAMCGLRASEFGDGRDNLSGHAQVAHGLVSGDVGSYEPEEWRQRQGTPAGAGLGELRYRLDLAA